VLAAHVGLALFPDLGEEGAWHRSQLDHKNESRQQRGPEVIGVTGCKLLDLFRETVREHCPDSGCHFPHMQIPNAYYLIIDLEATCSEDGTVPRHEMEIIEIGAVMQSSRTFEVESEFQTFIRPVRHPELTEFGTRLTGIASADVAGAPPFHKALEAMKRWMDGFGDSLFCSWGDYDRNQFIQDCEYHGVAYPFGSGHLNVKAEFSRMLGRRKKLGIDDAVRLLGMQFEGSHHRGLDDAHNIARIVRRVCMAA
jgi:inhibitor of KinA sporulation pathway (predicted exonuclease)